MNIEDLNLSNRTYNALKRNGVNTVEQICMISYDNMLNYRGIGNKGMNEIKTKLIGLANRK